ncbi:MAG: 6-carboxytetrahydropterin synthase QueD [Candidatus Omnitrophota bacterium]
MYKLIVKSKFSSAHKLREYHGKCEELHGHNWNIEAVVCAQETNNIGLVIDFKILKEKLNKVLDMLDHKYLNDIEYFSAKCETSPQSGGTKNNPSSENIAKYIYDNLKKELSGCKLQEIRVWETDTSCAVYSESRPAGEADE